MWNKKEPPVVLKPPYCFIHGCFIIHSITVEILLKEILEGNKRRAVLISTCDTLDITAQAQIPKIPGTHYCFFDGRPGGPGRGS